MPGFNVQVLTNSCQDDGTFKRDASKQGPSYLVETARKHRYSLEVLEPLGDKASGILLFLSKCTRPSADIDEIVIHSGQDEIRRPGKHRWKAVEFTFYEKMDSSEPPFINQTARLIFEWWAEQMIVVSESRQGDLDDYLKNAQLEMLDGVGDAVWTYNLYDTWPSRVNPSDLAYSDTAIAEISVTLNFSKAVETSD